MNKTMRDTFALSAFSLIYARSASEYDNVVRFVNAIVASANMVNTASDQQISLWHECTRQLRALRSARSNKRITRQEYIDKVRQLFASRLGGLRLRAWEIDAIADGLDGEGVDQCQSD